MVGRRLCLGHSTEEATNRDDAWANSIRSNSSSNTIIIAALCEPHHQQATIIIVSILTTTTMTRTMVVSVTSFTWISPGNQTLTLGESRS